MNQDLPPIARWILLLALALPSAPAAAQTTETASTATSSIATADPAATAKTAKDKPLVDYSLTIEYRAQRLSNRPLSLNDNTAEKVDYLEQRLRLGASAQVAGMVQVVVLADVLDGVLFGDNGSYVGEPKTNYGLRLGTKQPNLATFGIDRLDPTGSSIDRENYGIVLVPADLIKVRHAYGEVLLPLGMLRVGRQPMALGRTPISHDGSRINRWGVSRTADSVDAVTFGTKLSAIFDAVRGDPIDKSQEQGWFLAFHWGQLVEDLPQLDDDLYQVAGITFYKDQNLKLLGIPIDDLYAGLIVSHRYGDVFDSKIYNIAAMFEAENQWFRFVAHYAMFLGKTREVSEGLSLLNDAQAPALQNVLAYGGFAELAVKLSRFFEPSFEVYYASGDDDPSTDSNLTQMTLAQDTNVGLHLFENVLNYASGRSAAIGRVNLNALGVESFPTDQVWTRSGLQNAVVLFPQILSYPLDWMSLRTGVMFAFTQSRSVDPIGTLLRSDGVSLEDDLVNYNGGAPGTYWGTEFDFGLTLSPGYGFLFDFELAYLVPGDALQDSNGDAVNSWFNAVRFTYVFE